LANAVDIASTSLSREDDFRYQARARFDLAVIERNRDLRKMKYGVRS
jgi:hypothetical protein